MSDQFVTVEVDADAEVLKQDVILAIQDRWPQWLPYPGNLETAIIDGSSRLGADLAGLAGDVTTAIFREFGRTVAGIPPIDASPATVSTTWTAIDDAGYTIREGMQVTIAATGDESYGFTVVSEVVIPPGDEATASGAVELQAIRPGAAANDLSADPQPVDALDWLLSIESVGDSSGGADAETDIEFLTRLRDELRLMTPRPILPVDFGVLANRRASVFRSLVLDGFDPSDDSTDNERMVTIFPVDVNGDALSGGEKTSLQDEMEAKREQNFVVNIADPDYVAIDVSVVGVCLPSADPGEVDAAVTAALTAYLSPGNWGRSVFDNPTGWRQEKTVRYLEVAEVVNRVAGFDYITSLTVEGGTTNYALTGAAPLTTPGTIAATINAPS